MLGLVDPKSCHIGCHIGKKHVSTCRTSDLAPDAIEHCMGSMAKCGNFNHGKWQNAESIMCLYIGFFHALTLLHIIFYIWISTGCPVVIVVKVRRKNDGPWWSDMVHNCPSHTGQLSPNLESRFVGAVVIFVSHLVMRKPLSTFL